MPSSNAGTIAAQQQQQQEQAIEQGQSQINSAFSGFTPDYYNSIKQSYLDFATPQLESQYGTNVKQLQGNLFGQGLQKSSAASNELGQLNTNLAQSQAGLVNSAQGAANTQEQQVQQQENTLNSQLQASSDPLSVAQGALASAASVQAPSSFAPIGNLFSNFQNQYGAQQQVNAYSNLNNLLNSAISSGYVGASNPGFASIGSSGVIH